MYVSSVVILSLVWLLRTDRPLYLDLVTISFNFVLTIITDYKAEIFFCVNYTCYRDQRFSPWLIQKYVSAVSGNFYSIVKCFSVQKG